MRRTPDGRSRSGRRHSANGRLPGHSGHAGSGRSSAVTGTHGPASDCRTTGQTRTTDEPPWDAHRSRMDRAWMPGGPCLQRRWTVWTQWIQWTHLWETASQGTMLEWLDVRGMRPHLGTALPCTATKDVDGRQDPQGPRTPRLSLATPTLQKRPGPPGRVRHHTTSRVTRLRKTSIAPRQAVSARSRTGSPSGRTVPTSHARSEHDQTDDQRTVP